MKRKGCGRRWSWPNLRYDPAIFLEELRKTTENLCQDYWSLADFNPGPPECEGRVLTTQP
jgi:hypothetical protein